MSVDQAPPSRAGKMTRRDPGGEVDTRRPGSDGRRSIGGWFKKALGRGLKVAGDSGTAVFGPQAEPLRENLRDLGEGLDPSPPADATWVVNERAWIDFHARVEVALELIELDLDCASPVAWARILQLPIAKGEQLIQALRTALKGAAGWQRGLTDASGYLDDVRRTAAALSRLLDESETGAVGRRQALSAKISEARTALKQVLVTTQRLVGATEAYGGAGLAGGSEKEPAESPG